MPDITCCTGRNNHCENSDDNSGTAGVCPQRDNCYRFTAEPNPYRQSYFVVAPFATPENIVDNKCRYFISND